MRIGRFILITPQTVINLVTDLFSGYEKPLDRLAALLGVQADTSSILWLTATNFPLAGNVDTPIEWDTEVADTEGLWTPTAPTVITIPAGKAGIYIASLYLYIAVDHLGSWLNTIFDFDPEVKMDFWVPPNVDSESTTRATHLVITGAREGQIRLLSSGDSSNEVISFAELVLTRLRAIPGT